MVGEKEKTHKNPKGLHSALGAKKLHYFSVPNLNTFAEKGDVMLRIIIFLMSFCILPVQLTFSQQWIENTNPGKNYLNIAADSDINIVFSRNILQSSLNPSNITVRGSIKALYNPSFKYNSENHSVTMHSDEPFKTGENIFVTVSGNIQDTQGNHMGKGVNWMFTVQAQKGTGFFSVDPNIYITGIYPGEIISKDIDNDNDIDIIVANKLSYNVELFKNNGSGNFIKSVIIQESDVISDLKAADIDNDGRMDILISLENLNLIRVYKNNGDNTFTLISSLLTGRRPISMVVSNFDPDILPDLAVADWDDDVVSLYKNFGSGNFQFYNYLYPGYRPLSLLAGDFDNDGDNDLAAGIDFAPAEVTLLRNDGNGNFINYAVILTRDRPYSISGNDFTGDHFLDMCVSNLYDNSLSLLVNNGINFNSYLLTFGGSYPRVIVNADFDHDGDMDLAVNASNSSNITVYSNDGNNSFTGRIILNPLGNSYSITANDFDNDGDIDIASTNHNSNALVIFKNINSVGIEPVGNSVPDKYELSQNYPNPFNPFTSIKFKTAKSGSVNLDLYDPLGNLKGNLVNDLLAAGDYEFKLDAGKFNLSSGVYFYRIKAGDYSQTRQMILIK